MAKKSKAKSESKAKAAPAMKHKAPEAVNTVVAVSAPEAALAEAAAKSNAVATVQNGITIPREGSLCRRVWDVLDALRAKSQETTFDAVRELAGSEMADATIRTQRQRWREFNGVKREAKKPTRESKSAASAVVSEEVGHASQS